MAISIVLGIENEKYTQLQQSKSGIIGLIYGTL